jgi:hypothetical protein
MLLSLSSFGFSQVENSASTNASLLCGPPLYGCARSDLIKTDNLNPPPGITRGKNAIVTPLDFRLPIVRITDSSTFKGESMSASMSGSNSDNMFNTDDTYLLVADTNGWKYPVAFNPSTMQVVNSGPWNIGTNQVRWGGPGSFSRSKRSVVYAIPGPSTPVPGVVGNATSLYALTLSGTASISATGSKVFDFSKCQGMPSPYDIGHGIWHSTLTVSSGDRRFSEAFSNRVGGQNTGTDVTVYDAPTGQCYRYDTAHAKLCTSSGCVPMSLPDTFTIHEVYMSLDGNYLRIVFGRCISGSCKQGVGSHPYFWKIGTTDVVRCYNSSHTANCSGHMVEGYSHIYNSIVWPSTGKRSFTDPLSYTLINSTPELRPLTDSHYSNNAADPDDTHPYWVTNVQNIRTSFGGAGCNRIGNLYEGCTFPGPLYGEIFGITQNGSYIRAAHTYNSGSSAYFNCASTIGTVSQTGKFFVWTSDWLTTLGKDNTNHNRCDVFVVKVAATQGAPN